MTVRPNVSGSPYKKGVGSNQLIKNRLASITHANHTPEEIERLKVSTYATSFKKDILFQQDVRINL